VKSDESESGQSAVSPGRTKLHGAHLRTLEALLGIVLSPDTFQARALDLPMLLDEVVEVANLSLEDERWRAHLPMVADELHECRQTEHSYLAIEHRLRTNSSDITTYKKDCRATLERE
jgi:transcriptional regulator with GAF, ATPase, and Fis domain